MPTAPQLRLEGNAHFEAGRLDDAILCFQAAVDLFIEERSTTPESVEEFVKSAGNLCVCLHSSKRLEECFKMAREVLGIYPVIPKAYGAIGMCIMDKLTEQQQQVAAAAAETAEVPASVTAAGDSPSRPSTASLTSSLNAGEVARRDPHRYVAKLDGILCSVDEAHEYLCRAVALSEGALQVSLGPFIELAVRQINEQFISACHALERQHGNGLLDALCAPEVSLEGAPLCLSSASPAVRNTVMAIDPAGPNGGRQPVVVPRDEAAAILADATAKQQQQQQQPQQQGSLSDTASAHHLYDFALSGKPTSVRVCHAERGGLPRGLTLLRADRPFAVAAWLTPAPAATPPMRATPEGSDAGRVEVLDEQGNVVPVTTLANGGSMRVGSGQAPPEPTPEMLVQHMEAMFGGAGGGAAAAAMGGAGPRAPSSLYCGHCGKEVTTQALMSAEASSCATCGGAVYCSADCRAAYAERHDRYECKLRVKLQELVVAAAAAKRAEAKGKRAQTQAKDSTAATTVIDEGEDNGAALPAGYGEEMPGSAWTSEHFLQHVLPLAIAVYGGLCAKAKGFEHVQAQLEKGVPRWRVAAIPAPALSALREVATMMEVNPLTDDAAHNTPKAREGLLQRIALMVRLYQCPPPLHAAAEDDRGEHPFSFFYAERLLFRHSCEPNCRWVSSTRTVVTGRFICKGEELTLAVEDNEGSSGLGAGTPAESFPQHWPWQIRRKWLLRHHAFDCGCARCEREGEHLNTARGDLSNDTTEQLLSGDRLRRPKMASTESVTHPTHYFHPRLHKAIEEARRTARLGGPDNARRAIHALQDARKNAEPFLLPTHYLFEDLRDALSRVAAVQSLDEGDVSLYRAVGAASLLFYEAMWAGAIPAKVAVMERLPAPPEGASRRRAYLRQMRNARAAAAASSAATPSTPPSAEIASSTCATVPGEAYSGLADDDDSPEKKRRQAELRAAASAATTAVAEGASTLDGRRSSGEANVGGGSFRIGANRRRRQPPPRMERDFSEGTLAEHFYGSYQTWYS